MNLPCTANENLLHIEKISPEDKVIGLAGNPNVGKSTVFNQVTGLRQHTGNWPGKTVSNAQGYCSYQGRGYVWVDVPGCYSLSAHSAEEEAARDFICFGQADVMVVVCDAVCLERGLNLVLQVLELCPNTVVCVNLMDEAKRKGIHIDLSLLSERLGVPVIGTAALTRQGVDSLLSAADRLARAPLSSVSAHVTYPSLTEQLLAILEPAVAQAAGDALPARWLAGRLLEQDPSCLNTCKEILGYDLLQKPCIQQALKEAALLIEKENSTMEAVRDTIPTGLVHTAEQLCQGVVTFQKKSFDTKDRLLDNLFISKKTGFPIMLLLLLGVFWLTITGANYPSQLLSSVLFQAEDWLYSFLINLSVPAVLCEMLAHGAFRVLAWVVSVMLPPMAIFFPLFTLLEDFGYLPRVAFNLDKCFQKCHACGKQALTMCMGFGCNAAGVTGCRIIDSPRERLIAMLTNSFVPCNGRFPILIAILSMFFIGTTPGLWNSLGCAALLALLIILGVIATFISSWLLSSSVLKGVPSSFTLELPPYRKPKAGDVIIRSILDRTLFVLGRAVVVAAPAGAIIWLLANISIGDTALLAYCSDFLDPFASLLGMDGVILLAFILGFPANEIVFPIIIMCYLSQGTLIELEDLSALRQLLLENGWTWVTAVSTMLFALLHWPCSTTCLTLHKECGSWKWTALGFLLPTFAGIAVCFLFTTVTRLFV